MIFYRGGQDCLVIDIEEKGILSEIKGLIPTGHSVISIIGNRKGTRVFSLVKRPGGKATKIVYYQKDATPEIFLKNISNIPKISECDWAACTTSFDQKYIYLVGETDGVGAAGIIRFSKSFRYSGFSKLNHGPLTCISRIKGTDILLAGGDNFITILTFDKKNTRMSEIHTYTDLGCGIVDDILFISDKTYYLGRKSGLGIIKYLKGVDHEEFYNKENRWNDAGKNFIHKGITKMKLIL